MLGDVEPPLRNQTTNDELERKLRLSLAKSGALNVIGTDDDALLICARGVFRCALKLVIDRDR
jgi:hypothetical protein